MYQSFLWLYHNATLLLMSRGSIQHPVLFCKVQLMHFCYFFINTVACMIPTAVMQFTNLFLSSVIDNVNILIINVSLQLILRKFSISYIYVHSQFWHWLLTLAIMWRLWFYEKRVRNVFVTWLKMSSKLTLMPLTQCRRNVMHTVL